MYFVTITNGSYRNHPINGTFELYAAWKPGSRGGFVTVIVPKPLVAPFTQDRVRINCREEDAVVSLNGEKVEFSVGAMQTPGIAPIFNTERMMHYTPNNNNSPAPKSAVAIQREYLQNETSEESKARVRRTFEIVGELTEATAKGIVRGLIISGPPGIGKSFEIEEVLQREHELSGEEDFEQRFKIVKGAGSATNLYQLLYHYRHSGQVLVLDDADDFLWDETSLNLLKAALDSGKRRRIGYHKEARFLIENDIPKSFDFEGAVVFLTNLKFDASRSEKIRKHLEALQSRCHYLDLEINDVKDIMIRIEQVIDDGMLDRYDFTDEEKQEVVGFIRDNQEFLRDVSLRMVNKVADFRASSDKWEEYAIETCLRPNAKILRLAKLKQQAEELANPPVPENVDADETPVQEEQPETE